MNKIITLILIVLASSHLYSQKLTVGIKGGLNLSTSWSSPLLKFSELIKMEPMFHIGGIVDLRVSRKLNLAIDPQFSLEGNISRNSGRISGRYLGFINFPIYLKYYTSEKRSFNLQVGVKPGVLVLAKNVRKSKGEERIYTDIYGSTTDRFDFGIPFGCGFDYRNGVSLDFRYILGLKGLLEGVSWYSHVIQISLACKFN